MKTVYFPCLSKRLINYLILGEFQRKIWLSMFYNMMIVYLRRKLMDSKVN